MLDAVAQHVRQTGIGAVRAGEDAEREERERAQRRQQEHDEETARRAAEDAASAQHPSGPRRVAW